MMERFLFKVTADLPFREIMEEGRQYLERYYLFTIPALKIGNWIIRGRRFYIHRFLDSDPDRGMHDHPWLKAWTFILFGWYWESTDYGIQTRKWFGVIHGDKFHRVILSTRIVEGFDGDTQRSYRKRVPVPCWTLFCHTVEHQSISPNEKAKAWGFRRPTSKEGIYTYQVHKYASEGNKDYWWLNAPTRRQIYGY